MTSIAIIPARGGSKRIPRKNIADLGGRPMIAYPIAACRASGLFDDVVVSTEDPEIAEISRTAGATVDDRPAELAADRVPAALACQELLARRYSDETRPDWFCLVYPMAAFINPDDLITAAADRNGADAVLGVSAYPMHPYKALVDRDGFMRPLWPEENARQSQSYPDTYASNGTFCWVRVSPFMAAPSFYPDRLRAHVMTPDRATDIDTPEDLDHARRLMRLRSMDTE